MAATTKERPSRFKKVSTADMPIGANVKAWKGAAAVIDTRAASATRGFAIPAVAAPDLVACGRFARTVNNTGGANGAKNVSIDYGREFTVFVWNNSTAMPIVAADRGSLAYFEDDQTVTSDDEDASVAGRIFRVGSDGLIEVEVLP